jgi:hypothetical protein
MTGIRALMVLAMLPQFVAVGAFSTFLTIERSTEGRKRGNGRHNDRQLLLTRFQTKTVNHLVV